MPQFFDQSVAKIHAADTRLVLAVTGGGSQAIADLLKVPGASRTVLEAVVPYAGTALEEFLGAEPEQSCSARTARAMAMAGYIRAGQLDTSGVPLAGVAATAGSFNRANTALHRAAGSVLSGSVTSERTAS